jgi:hypothetical protein
MNAGEPLWKILPTRDEAGKPLVDFMLLLPRLRDKPKNQIDMMLATLEGVLKGFREVVFVNLNLPLSLLWVSLQFRPGIMLEVVSAIQIKIPGARLVAHKF